MCVRPAAAQPTIAIVAGSAEEANEFAKHFNVRRKDWFYVSDPAIVFGRSGLVVVRTGSYAKRKDIEAIEHALYLCEIATASRYQKMTAA